MGEENLKSNALGATTPTTSSNANLVEWFNLGNDYCIDQYSKYYANPNTWFSEESKTVNINSSLDNEEGKKILEETCLELRDDINSKSDIVGWTVLSVSEYDFSTSEERLAFRTNKDAWITEFSIYVELTKDSSTNKYYRSIYVSPEYTTDWIDKEDVEEAVDKIEKFFSTHKESTGKALEELEKLLRNKLGNTSTSSYRKNYNYKTKLGDTIDPNIKYTLKTGYAFADLDTAIGVNNNGSITTSASTI